MMTSKTAQHSGNILNMAKAGQRVVALAIATAIGLILALGPGPAQAQFQPVARVDGMVVTAFELTERQKFLTLLRAPGDVRSLALDQLINEKIQMREADKAGVTVDEDAIKAGMEEFAARGNLSAEEFTGFLAQAGISVSTFRDFVTAGVTWREYVKAEFVPLVSVSEADVDQAMSKAVADPGLRVLLSEIALPAGDPATRRASMARAQRLTGLDEEEFSKAAMRFSVGPSRNNGGKMKWGDITSLPPSTVAAVRGLRPGQTSRIVEVDDTLRLYFMRDREEVSGGTPRTMVEYAALLLPGGQSEANQSEAARIRAEVTSCDDLYPIARGLPPEQLVREEVAESQIPATYRAEIDRLDAGEISSRVTTSSGAMALLMVCKRGNELPKSLTREAVKTQLQNQRVTTMAQAFLEGKRANAYIERLGN